MRSSLLYVKSIFLGHRYLFYLVPFFAIIGYIIVFLFKKIEVYGLIKELLVNKGNPIAAIRLGQVNYFSESIYLLLILPLLELLFIQKLFYRIYDFTLPIGPIQRFMAYILTATIIYLTNLIIILTLNYFLQLYLQIQFLEISKNASIDLGFLYEPIGEKSIFFNASVNRELLTYGNLYFLTLPFLFISLLMFRRQSILKVFAITVAGGFVGMYFLAKVWTGEYYFINNKNYVTNYPLIVFGLSSIFCYWGFFQLLKDKEV